MEKNPLSRIKRANKSIFWAMIAICVILLINMVITAVIIQENKELKASRGHHCPFGKCPYMGYLQFPGVIATGDSVIYDSDPASDVYKLDKLHFKYPAASYDDLEETLIKTDSTYKP